MLIYVDIYICLYIELTVYLGIDHKCQSVKKDKKKMRKIHKSILYLTSLISPLILPMISAPAFAASHAGYTVRDVNLREGAGIYYKVMDVIPGNSRVWINSCRPNWCNVSYRGWQGWMSSAYLTYAATAVPTTNTHIYFELGDSDDSYDTVPIYRYKNYHHHHHHVDLQPWPWADDDDSGQELDPSPSGPLEPGHQTMTTSETER